MQKVKFGKTISGQYGLFTNGMLAWGFVVNGDKLNTSFYSNSDWNKMTESQKIAFCKSIGFEYIN